MLDNFHNWSKRVSDIDNTIPFKMFVWFGLDSMADYYRGFAFAYAQNKVKLLTRF